ncbi:helix-turn-helix domain-containing protein [Archangium lansingense]|uniref:Helix-turn-helix transcriptional regulator n=1 Tax=Archangium lansingense TaxID=2995310 RepID=A0ABT3ZW60_9BACT|nr:helix-turn-helix transcriptional regulator [Archangium lansinium]MCY1073634.1 helix-turn-helix transcriptional regulator [Archangium lansinium]
MPQRHKTRDALALQLGKMARAAREKAGLTQQEAAERVGVVTEVYGRMERGLLLPSLPTLLRVCRALRVDANSLLGFSFTKAPVWLAQPPAIDSEPPAVRRLLRTVRRLKPRQLHALSTVANAMLPAQETRDGCDSRQTTN